MSDPQKKTIEEILNAVYSGTELAGVASAEEILNVVFNEAEGALNLSSTGSALPTASGDGQFLVSDGADWEASGSGLVLTNFGAYPMLSGDSSYLYIDSNFTLRLRSTGGLEPSSDESSSIGSTGRRFEKLYAGGIASDRSGTYPFTTIYGGAASGAVATALKVENTETGADGGGTSLKLSGYDALDVATDFLTLSAYWLDEAAGTIQVDFEGADLYTFGAEVKPTGYNAADGTAGATADVALLASDGTTTRTLHFKNGLYTGHTDT